MKYNFPKIKQNQDKTFGPTKNEHFYLPVFYHNKSAKNNSNKTKWILKRNEQFEVFRVADENNWICKETNGLFSILDNGNVIFGENEERISFFPIPQNSIDNWHGFPINSGEYEPSTILVDKWLNDEIIDKRLHIKILKGQI